MRINGRINDESDKEMRHESLDLGLRYPGVHQFFRKNSIKTEE